MQTLKHSALQLLLHTAVRVHQASYRLIQWCENQLDEYESIDEIVAEIFGTDRQASNPPAQQIRFIRIGRPGLH